MIEYTDVNSVLVGHLQLSFQHVPSLVGFMLLLVLHKESSCLLSIFPPRVEQAN